MIESKVIALFNRRYSQVRDMMDIFLFQDTFVPDSHRRLHAKFKKIGISATRIVDRIGKLEDNRSVHVRTIDGIIEDQLDAHVAANIKSAGGGAMIFGTVMPLVKRILKVTKT